jgi:hypothetical protein
LIVIHRVLVYLGFRLDRFHYKYCIEIQGSPHLQKIGILDFSLGEHEGEVKAWQGDMFSQKYVFFHFFLHLKCVFANILFISFIFNIKFMFCICFIIIIDLIFIDFRFIHFCLEICQWHLNVRFLPPISYVHMIAVFKT